MNVENYILQLVNEKSIPDCPVQCFIVVRCLLSIIYIFTFEIAFFVALFPQLYSTSISLSIDFRIINDSMFFLFLEPLSPAYIKQLLTARSRLCLWTFIFDLLQTESARDIVSWTNRDQLEFKIVNSDKLALVWGEVRGRKNMTYSTLTRTLSYYYGKELLEKVTTLFYCISNT